MQNPSSHWEQILCMADDAEECDPPLLSEEQAETLLTMITEKNENILMIYRSCLSGRDANTRLTRFTKNLKRMLSNLESK